MIQPLKQLQYRHYLQLLNTIKQMDILLKLLQEHKIDVKTAASIMGMNEDEFAKAVKECQEV